MIIVPFFYFITRIQSLVTFLLNMKLLNVAIRIINR